MEYRVYSNLHDIAQMSREWNAALAASPGNRAFSSLEWYLASCRIEKSAIPYLIVAGSAAAPLCIAPLVLDIADGTARFPHYANDYNDVMSCGSSHAQIAGLLSHVIAKENACQRLLLSRLRVDSSCAGALAFLQLNAGLKCNSKPINVYPYINLPSSFEEYLATRSKAFRKSIRRVLRKVCMDGLRLQELVPEEFEPHNLPEILISLALERQKERSFLNKPETQAFVREVLPAMFVKRDLRAFGLWKEEQILGLDICMVRNNGLLTWNGGFKSGAECWSPGTALFAFGIKQAIAMGMQEYDFTEGKESYKISWANANYCVLEADISVNEDTNKVSATGIECMPSTVSQ